MVTHLIWLSAVGAVAGSQPATGSTSVAVVNVALCSEQYARTAALEAKFELTRTRMQEERDTRRARMEQTARMLQEELKPGTEAYDAKRKELAMMDADLKWFVESKGREIERGLAQSLGMIYKDIQAATREVAEAKGIDVVLAGDVIQEDGPDTPNQARQQILLQKVVYWSPTVDITEEVVARLNTNFKATSSAAPAGGSAPKPVSPGGSD